MTLMRRSRKTLTPTAGAAARLIAAAGLLALLVLFQRAGVARAEDAPEEQAPPPTVVGTWDYAKSLDHGRAIVRGAFQKAIAQLGFIQRRLAQRKLDSSDPLVRTIVISEEGGRIALELIGEKTTDLASRAGVTEKITGPNGNEVDLTQRLLKSGTLLDQVFVGPKGRTRNRYVLSKDGQRLTYSTHVEGERLETPIEFRLVYKRRAR